MSQSPLAARGGVLSYLQLEMKIDMKNAFFFKFCICVVIKEQFEHDNEPYTNFI